MFEKYKQTKKINSAKQIVKIKALEVSEKMSKIVDHLEIIKDLKINDSNEIYLKEKNMLVNLYDFYCKYQILYFDLSFSQILNPIDSFMVKNMVKNMDIKDFATKLKDYHKKDYEVTIEYLKDEDKISIKNIYDQFENTVDDLINTLIKIQSNIIINEIQPIQENVMIEKVKTIINPDNVLSNMKLIDNDYNKYMDEINASKEIF